MACPFFKETYIGYCSASGFPYTPSIIEMEQLCFKDNFKCCVHFNNLHASDKIVKKTFPQSRVEPPAPVIF